MMYKLCWDGSKELWDKDKGYNLPVVGAKDTGIRPEVYEEIIARLSM